MQFVEPQVFLVSKPEIQWESVRDYLRLVGGESWADKRQDVTPDAQNLVEFGGRLCYRSWEPGLNPNVTKVREDQDDYLGNVTRSGHGSVLEHSYFSFVFHNVSRVATHEVVRHRAGVAISQESMRFVRLQDINVVAPPEFQEGEVGQKVIELVEQLEEFQKSASEDFGLDDEGVPFHYKKQVTSALRRLAPIGVATGMLWTANIRTIRHVITMRTAVGAEWEIRKLFQKVGEVISQECPGFFSDFTVDEEGQWIPGYNKV